MATAHRRCERPSGGWCCQLQPASRFGLTDEQLWAEAQRLVQLGWSLDEIRVVLELPVLA